MSILITSDIQAEFMNLDLCQQAWSECLSICKEKGIKTIAYLGDGKQAYNPVDIRVNKWWRKAIRQANKLGIQVLFLLGNHDRVGQHKDSDNWLSLLKSYGAETFDEIAVVKLDNMRLFMLPFSNMSTAKKNIKRLLRFKPDKNKDVLLFHHDVCGASYNNLGGSSNARLSGMDMYCSSFRYCVGGHIHKPQKVKGTDNIYFVGSPFTQDWGEVNQRKRYLIIRNDEGIESINSTIPGWFDASIHGFTESTPSSWRGARVRVSVSCDVSEDYGRRLEKARRDAETKYRGAEILVVPKFTERSESIHEGIKASDSDERKLKEYIRQARVHKSLGKKVALDYMLEKLSNFSTGLRTGSKVKFLYAKGKNFLPFKELTTDFTQKGITVIQGINEDRNGKSNGAAKTSLVQILPVSMFGRTFKDQKHDKWANRWTDDPATAEVVLQDYKSRKIKIKRGRRPVLLQMSVNGKDKSSGMRSNDKDGTQSQIEQVTGFVWSTLANAVYIDRTVADAFLSGTRKQRTDVLSRFQNLERFEKALDLVKKDERKNREALLQASEDLSGVRSSVKECEESVRSLKQMSKTQLDSAYKEYSKRKRELKKWLPNLKLFKLLEKKADKLKDKYDKGIKGLTQLEKDKAVLLSDVDKLEKEGIKLYRLKKKKKCPTCYQKVSYRWIKEKSDSADAGFKISKHKLNVLSDELTKYRKDLQLLDGEYTQLQRKLGNMDTEHRTLVGFKKTAQEQWMELSSSEHASNTIINKTKRKLHELIAKKQHIKHVIKRCNRLNMLHEFANEAFSRNGIPAYLNRLLCPVLNKAASYYAELFSDNEIQLQFKVHKGEFIPEVINTKGGEGIDDQSTGERALAGLIASFALREVAPRCNLLILDEVGEGLDEQTAKQFARSLQVLKKRFTSIWVCSHNVHVLSELSGERIITVRKKDGISKII